MSDHALVEGLAGLASRVDSLSHLTEGDESRTLEDQEDRLAKLTLVAIALDMDATNAKYRDAVNRVQAAIDAIGDARTRRFRTSPRSFHASPRRSTSPKSS